MVFNIIGGGDYDESLNNFEYIHYIYIYVYTPMFSHYTTMFQWPLQEPKLEVIIYLPYERPM